MCAMKIINVDEKLIYYMYTNLQKLVNINNSHL